MGIDAAQNGIDLVTAQAGFTILDDGIAPPPDLAGRTRIGITRATDQLWRWYVSDSEYVSKC
jgi:DNA-3-methyladenine glycosylase